MANIKETETHYTFRSNIGNIGDSFFYLPHWYKENHVLITYVQGKAPAQHADWLAYLGKRGISHEIIGSYVLVMPESVEQMFVDENTFRGLSEMYVSRKRPTAETVPAKVYPADGCDFNTAVPDGFMDGLIALDALVYMSECGDGVNIAHKHKEEIIYFVKEMSVEEL
ncbi:MAG: hypothetical protein HZC51_04480 [Nitrospirae bacterium]|nr:hypothetical protein [Nitrospirota bacterium]